MTRRWTNSLAKAKTAHEAHTTAARYLAARILKTIQELDQRGHEGKDWADVGTISDIHADLMALSDKLHQEGEYKGEESAQWRHRTFARALEV